MTEVEFSAQLSQLAAAAKTLNSESDSINAVLAQLEEQIRATNVGISVSVALAVNNSASWLQWTKLYKRNPGAGGYIVSDPYWGLAVDERPVLECSRDARIAVLDALPVLVMSLTEEAEKRVASIKEAKDLVK